MTGEYILVNKPAGPTSHDVVDMVRKIKKTRQVGHAGTLDPVAEGLLIILVGDYTKKSNEFMKLSKEYSATFKLGADSDTHDLEGKVEEHKDFKIPNRDDVEKVLEKFRGKIKQIPPQFSAIKIGGRKAYDEARAGRVVELAPRDIEIFALEILGFNFPKLELRIACSSGTYIRSLARDIGEALGTGAIMTFLRRDKIGDYELKDAQNLDELK